MRRITVSTLGLGMILALAGACTSNPESTIDAPSADGGSGEVTGGEIIVSGDLSAGDAADATDRSAEPAPDDAAGTTTPPTTSAPTPATTRPPASTASGNTNTASTSTVTTEAEVFGDGPVLTAPVDLDSGESPGAGTGLRPVFFALEATTTVRCADADPGSVQLRWEVIGTESVDVSVGFIGDIRSSDEPPAGTIDLSLDCATGSQYFVIAENPDGETIRSVTVGIG